MTEEEWDTAASLSDKLAFLGQRISERKLRLLACAAARMEWALLTDDRSRAAVEIAEGFADGLATEKARESARRRAIETHDEVKNRGYKDRRKYTAQAAAAYLPILALWPAFGDADWEDFGNPFDVSGDGIGEQLGFVAKYAVFRDIFGNPFRPVAFDPAWRTSTAVAIARQVYESRDFGAMPILADALMDAGCDSADVLDHCRGDTPHVRGCWVVDLVLGKA